MGAVETILHPPADPTSRVVIAIIRHTAVVQTTLHQHEAMRTMAVDASIHRTVVASIRLQQPKDPNMKDAPAIHSSSVVVQMVLQYQPAPITTVAIAHKPSTNAVLTALHQPKDRISRVALAYRANMAAVWMELPQLKAHDLRDVMKCYPNHRKHVATERMAATAPITLLSTSLMLNMVAAPDSGTADVAVMTIVSKLLKTVRLRVKNQLARVHAHCQRFMDHVPDIIQCIITIRIEMPVRNLFSVAVWVTTIDLRRWKLAKNFVWLTIPHVSIIIILFRQLPGKVSNLALIGSCL